MIKREYWSKSREMNKIVSGEEKSKNGLWEVLHVDCMLFKRTDDFVYHI